MARLSTYTKDLNITGKDMLTGSNYVTTVNNIDQFETNNFTIEKLTEYFAGQISIDPGNLSLKTNGGIVYETVLGTDFLAIDLSATNITGQLANSDLVNSYITINGSNIELGGSIDIPVGDITSVIAGTYLNGGGTINDVTINHNDTSRSDTSSSPSQLAYDGTFTAITSVSTNATGHLTAINTATYTLPSSDETNDYVDSIAVTGTTTKTITLGRTGTLSDLTADFTDNDTIPNDATITLSAGTYISGGGDFTTDQSSAETITFNHDSTTRTDTTSSVGPNHGANFTVIDTLTSNATGHITAANVKTVTLPNGANDNTITLSAGTYLSGGGDFTVDQSFNETLTINHDSTTRSDTTSTDNNNSHSDTFTVVDSISTNATGHVTGINVKTVSFPADTNQDIDVNVSNLETRLGQIGNTSIGSSGSTITIPNLTVTGTQTINNVEVISTSSGIVFEGTSNDANETTLNVINPTADRAINLPNNSGTVALLTDIPTVNDGTLTVQGSNGLTGSGTFTANDADSPTITISHADTSSQSSVNNSGNTFIQDITVDTYGHITGITSGTATDNDTITQIREDNSSYRTGNITLQSGTNVNITEPSAGVFNFAATDTNTTYSAGGGLDLNGTVFSHTDTSSQSSVNNSGRTYIQDITLDTYGHVTGLTSATETVTDTNTTYDLAVPSGTTYVRLSGSDGTTDDVLITGSGSTTVTRVSASALQISSTDTNTIPNNGTLTINTAGIASGGGTFTADQAGNSTITITATEADTLATVTGRGNTTSATIQVNQVIATNNGNGTNYRVGDDAWIGDTNIANTLRVSGVQDSTKGYITFGSNTAQLGRSGTGALTWDSNTIWHAGNDGAGTGLDADLLDGVQGNQYLRSTTNPGTSGTNANTTISIGDNGTSYAYVQSHGSKPLNFNPVGNAVQIAGNRILTVADEGSGNGLDADTLDGQHASAFLTSYTETDTLDTVTSRNNSTSNNILVGDIFRNGATGFYLKLNNNAQAMRAAGQIEINNDDSGIILLSTNSSASNASQLHLYHFFSDVFFQNLRGNIQLVANGYTYTNSSFGVGATPGVKLDVYDSSTSVNIIRARNATQQIALGVNNGSGGAFLFVNTNHDLRFGTNGSEVGRFKTSGEFVVAQNTSDTNAAMRLGGDNAPGGRLYLEYNGDNSYIDCYGGHGSTQRYRDLSIVSRNLYLKGNNNLGITVDSVGKVNVGSSASVPTNIQLQSSGDIRINSTSGSLWIGGHNDSTAGRVRLHSSNGAGYLDWEAATGTSNFVFRYDTSNRFEMSSGGTFTASADIVAYGSPSDITLKENIKPIENALDKVEKLQGVTFNWKESDSILDIKEDIGFIAQDVQKVLPELVRENENGKLSLRHQGIVPILLEAIKELSDKVKALENGITK